MLTITKMIIIINITLIMKTPSKDISSTSSFSFLIIKVIIYIDE